MKRLLFMMMAASVLTAAAQEEKNVTLNEVTVKGSRIVQKVDGQWIYPSKQQIETSPNGYSLLAKLTLPHIRVDEAMNSITALTNLGTVQVRIKLDKSGNVLDCRIEKSSGNNVFDASAVNAVNRTKQLPQPPTPAQQNLLINFNSLDMAGGR